MLVTGLLLAACDPGWFLHARNQSGQTVLLRVRLTPSVLEVYRLPAGFDGRVLGTLGEQDATIELLSEDCALLGATSTPGLGYVLISIDSALQVTAEQTAGEVAAAPSADDPPDAEELKGECGSTRAPSAGPTAYSHRRQGSQGSALGRQLGGSTKLPLGWLEIAKTALPG